MTTDSSHFSGAKIALLCDTHVLVYLRDDKPTIPYPNQWDLPGGGREGDETPAECALRELHEEFGLRLARDRIHWSREYARANIAAPHTTHFFVATLAMEETERIVFGHEGQHWRLMPVTEFLARDDAITHLQARLQDYLESTDARAAAT